MTTHPNDGLSARERDVIRLVVRGLRNARIARELGMQPATVKHHLESIFGKYHVENRIQAAIEWLRRLAEEGGAE